MRTIPITLILIASTLAAVVPSAAAEGPAPVLGNGNGLLAHYYDDTGYGRLRDLRIDASIQHDWGGAAPSPNLTGSSWSVVWTGKLQAEYNETYTFASTVDDNAYVWVDGVQVVARGCCGYVSQGSVALTTDVLHDITIQYQQGGGGSYFHLYWSSASQAQEEIPGTQLYAPDPVTTTPGSGTGLMGMFYDDTGYGRLRDIVPVVPFGGLDWGGAPPTANLTGSSWSAVFTGQIEAQLSQTYTFSSSADDNLYVYVNGVQVIARGCCGFTQQGAVALVKGQKYDITVQYQQGGGDSYLHLYWHSADQPLEEIPATQFYPAAAPAIPPLGTGTGLMGMFYDDTGYGRLRDIVPVVPFGGLNWGAAAPTTNLTGSSWSAVFTGKFQPQLNETYTFASSADDNLYVYIDGVQVIARGCCGFTQQGAMALRSDRLYNITVQYQQGGGDSYLHLYWSSATQPFEEIPATQFYPATPPTPLIAQGNGVLATYFSDLQWTDRAGARIEPALDDDWGGASPIDGVGPSSWSATFDARLIPEYNETYTFSSSANDNLYAYVNGVQVIARGCCGFTQQGSVALRAGVPVQLHAIYQQGDGESYSHIYWQSASTPFELIPQTQLAAPGVFFNDSSTPVDPLADDALVTLKLDPAQTAPVTAYYRTQAGTTSDFVPQNDSVTFAPGETEKTVAIPLVHSLSSGATPGDFRVTITRVDGSYVSAPGNETVSILAPDSPVRAVLNGVQGANGWYVSPVQVTIASAAGSAAQLLFRTSASASFESYQGPIVISADGDHTVEYYAIDGLGHAGETRSTSFRIDAHAPSIVATPDAVASAGWYSGTVNVALAATDATAGVASMSYVLDHGTPFPYTGPIAITTAGVHTIAATALDLAGNVGTLTTSVKVDLDPPAISATTRTTGNDTIDNSWYHKDLDITLEATDPDGSGPSGLATTVGDGPTLDANGTRATIHLSGDGVHEISAVASDAVGHPAHALFTYLIDGVAPVADLPSVDGPTRDGVHVTPVDIRFSGTDATSGFAGVKVYNAPQGEVTLAPGQALHIATEGDITLDWQAFDVAGNLADLAHLPLSIHFAPVDVALSVDAPLAASGWYQAHSVPVTLAPGNGPVSAIEYEIDGTCGSLATYSAPIQLGEGRHTICYGAVNTDGVLGTLLSQTIDLDGTAPARDVDIAGIAVGPDQFLGHITKLTTTSDATSFLGSITCTFDGGACPADGIITAPGAHHLTLDVTDLAGNAAPQLVRDFTIVADTTPPVTTIHVDGTFSESGWSLTPATVSFTATDDAPPVTTFASVDGGAFVPVVGAFPLFAGAHVVRYQSVDTAGNVEAARSEIVRVDLAPPVTTILADGQPASALLRSNQQVLVTLRAADDASGVVGTKVQIDDDAPRDYDGAPIAIATTGHHLVRAFSTDAAGRQEGVVTVPIDIDVDAPQQAEAAFSPLTPVITLPNGTLAARTNATLDLAALDLGPDGVGNVASIEYQIGSGEVQTYQGPIHLDGEGAFHVHAIGIDSFGNRGLPLDLAVVVDLTAPVLSINITTDDALNFGDLAYLRADLCFHIPIQDLLGPLGIHNDPATAGVDYVLLTVKDPAENVIRQANITANEIVHSLDLPASLEISFCEGDLIARGDGWGGGTLGPGGYVFGGVACDGVGNCGQGIEKAFVKWGPPSVKIVRPEPGTLDLDSMVLPLYPDAARCERTLHEQGLDAAAPACAGVGAATDAGRTVAPDVAANLSALRIMAGKVPVYVRMSAGTIARDLNLRVDGRIVATQHDVVGASFNGSGSGLAVFLVDTTTLFGEPGGSPTDAVFRWSDLSADLVDGFNETAEDHAPVVIVNAEPHADEAAAALATVRDTVQASSAPNGTVHVAATARAPR